MTSSELTLDKKMQQQNPENQLQTSNQIQKINGSSLALKNPDNIGKFYSNQIKIKYLGQINQSTDSIFNEEPKLNLPKSSRINNFSKFQNHNMLMSNRSFRINKTKKSQIQFIKQKTPVNIGKISSKKLDIQVFQQQFPQITKSNQYELTKSPGRLYKKAKKNCEQTQCSIQTSKFGNLTLLQKSNPIIFKDELFIQSIKQKQKNLKRLIQKNIKRQKQVDIIPSVNSKFEEFNYNFTQRNRKIPKTKFQDLPYLQKIQTNSKNFKSFLELSKNNNNQKVNKKLAKAIDDHDVVLQKSRKTQNMRISPTIKVSFIIKSPKKLNQPTKINDNQNTYESSKIKLKDYNNRKPIFIDKSIDPINKQQNTIKRADLDLLYLKKYLALNKLVQKKQQKQDYETLSLDTKISNLKYLLIQSSNLLKLNIDLPEILFSQSFMNINSSNNQIRPFIQQIYEQLHIKPQLITIKRYRNALFIGVNNQKSIKNNFNMDDLSYKAIIWYFQQFCYYIGGYIISQQDQNTNNPDVLIGYKNGVGLYVQVNKLSQINQNQLKQVNLTQINRHLQLNKISNIETLQVKQLSQVNKVQKVTAFQQFKANLYYGEYQKNKKHGYGVKIQIIFEDIDGSAIQEVQIGHWQNDIKDGWVKQYQNKQLKKNVQYQKGIIINYHLSNSKQLKNTNQNQLIQEQTRNKKNNQLCPNNSSINLQISTNQKNLQTKFINQSN